MIDPNQISRRHFIAIATDTFEASGTFGPLDVAKEVASMRSWLFDNALGERRFQDEGFESLADKPTPADIRYRLAEQQLFTDADAVVLYVTGHGMTDKGVHWVVLHKSAPDRMTSTSIPTAELIRLLAEHRELAQVLLIIDLCEAGDVLDELPATLHRDLPGEWIALLTTPAEEVAKVGAFTGVVESVIEELRTSTDCDASELQPYLDSSVFIRRVKHRLREDHGQELTVLRDPYRTSCCLPNPRYDPSRVGRVKTSGARRDLAILRQDMATHWAPRAAVTSAMSEHGAVFAGRARLMSKLIEFAAGPLGTLVVSGRAGSGKSAALARLVTCSDPTFRADYHHLLTLAQPVPAEGAVDVAVLATGKTSEQIAYQILQALGSENRRDMADSSLDGCLNGIAAAVARRARDVTVVIDALDEATDPLTVAMTFLERLNPRDQPQLRLLVGIRSAGVESGPTRADVDDRIEVRNGSSVPSARDLADVVSQALGAERIWADGDELWEPQDLVDYIGQILTQPWSTYRDEPAKVRADIAWTVAQSGGRSYMLAGGVATQLAESGQVLSIHDPRLQSMLTQGIGDLLGRDIRLSIPDPRDRIRALLLLRATALAFGRGVPWRGVWRVIASAIASNAAEIVDSDIDWLLGHRVSGYLVRDLEDGATVYRPFHDELRSSLAGAADVYAAAGVADLHLDVVEAHRRITDRLVPGPNSE